VSETVSYGLTCLPVPAPHPAGCLLLITLTITVIAVRGKARYEDYERAQCTLISGVVTECELVCLVGKGEEWLG